MSIIFSHPSATDVTLSRSSKFPYNQTGKVVPNQLIGEAVGGAIKATTLGADKRFWFVDVEYETETNRNALLAFFADSDVNYSANTFTFYPDDGSSYTVRLWSALDGLDFPTLIDNGAKFYSIKLILRKEIT